MKKTSKRAFSLVELIIVIVIIAILSGAAYIGIQKAKSKSMNDKVLDDLIAITNSLEQFKRDHLGEYPMPVPGGNMNMNCFYADASYAHDCGSAAFIQGMIDNDLLTKRYLQEVPTDPRTDSRYVYGVSLDKKYFQVAGLYEQSDGTWIAKTVDNLGKGYHLPSLIRAYNGPNFVVNEGTNLPYSPDHMTLTATLENVNGTVTVGGDGKTNGDLVYPGDTIITDTGGSVDLFFSDGSVSHLSEDGQLEILTTSEVEENDSDNIITKIKIKLFSGKIWNKVARLASKSEFNVQTTSAIAGVRGTEFGVEIINSGAGTADVFVTSGQVDIFNLDGETTLDIIDNGTGDDVTPDVPRMIHILGENSVSGVTDIAENEIIETFGDFYENVYLNNDLRPHILQISGAEITVQNINDFYGLPEGEHITVNKLAVYTEPYAEGDISIKNITVVSSDPDDYAFDLFTPLPSDPVILRFEDTANSLVSGFTMPITITTSTQLTEDDLYEVAEEEEEEAPPGDCQIILDYPIGTFYTAPTTLNWHTTGCVISSFLVTGAGQGGLYNTTDTTRPLTDPITYGAYTWEVESADSFNPAPTVTADFDYVDSTAGCTPGEEAIDTTTMISNGTCTKTIVCTPEGVWPALPSTCTSITCNIEYELSGGICEPCTIAHPHPLNAHYISGCDWGCDAGYEVYGDDCVPVCGDGYVVGGEECDDSNTVDGDGCDACLMETGWVCTGQPSDCTLCPALPDNAIWALGCDWQCDTGFEEISGACYPDLMISCISNDTAYWADVTTSPLGKKNTIVNSYYSYNDTPGDYADDECWLLGIIGSDCTTACDFQLNLSCDPDPTWNDDASCGICENLLGTTPSSCVDDYVNTYAPWSAAGSLCRYRTTVNVDCLSSESGINRICKCQ